MGRKVFLPVRRFTGNEFEQTTLKPLKLLVGARVHGVRRHRRDCVLTTFKSWLMAWLGRRSQAVRCAD